MDRKKNLETCLVIVTGLLIIYLFRDWKPLLFAAAIIGFIGIFIDSIAAWITWFWYKLADILGKFIPKIILSIIFIVFLIPISFLYKAGLKDKLRLTNIKRDTMWYERNHSFSMDDLRKPW